MTVIKRKLKPELLLLFIGLLVFTAALFTASLQREIPTASKVYYVSDSEKAQLRTVGKAEVLKVNLNTASKEELVKITGIGEFVAEGIIAYREEKGGFKTVNELINVYGVGEYRYKQIAPYVTCE